MTETIDFWHVQRTYERHFASDETVVMPFAANGVPLCAVKYMDLAEKSRVIRNWKALLVHIVSNGCGREMPKCFTEALYEHLMQNCGHIAHYDRHGFWDAQLGSGSRALRFFSELAGTMSFTLQDYRDINAALLLTVWPVRASLIGRLAGDRRTEAVADIGRIALLAGLDMYGHSAPEAQPQATALLARRPVGVPTVQRPSVPAAATARNTKTRLEEAAAGQATLF